MNGVIPADHRTILEITGRDRRSVKRMMKRLRRILFNVLTAISLLLAIATAGLWVRQFFARDVLLLVISPDEVIRLESANGIIAFARISEGVGRFAAHDSEWKHDSATSVPFIRYVFPESGGFDFVHVGPTGGFPRLWALSIPLWLPLALDSVIPAAAIWRYRRRDVSRPGCCPACGYDMRANPARCSECGHEPAVAVRPDLTAACRRSGSS